MNLGKVIFVGGDRHKYGSIRVRCDSIARRLGCRAIYHPEYSDGLPQGYAVYVFVKPAIDNEVLKTIQKRGGVVLWDVIDKLPPTEGVDAFIVSTQHAIAQLPQGAAVHVVPHHHCNYMGRPNSGRDRNVVWIGSRHWCPVDSGIDFSPFYVNGLQRRQIERLYRRAGICVNFRSRPPLVETHIALNSGIKLINCVGFGVPSISADEPAYRELASDCTIFCAAQQANEVLLRLRTDGSFYRQLRQNCIERAGEFHIDAIVARYKRMLRSL